MSEKIVKKQSFLSGAAVLAGSVMLVKIIGMVYKILFANILGGVGNGIFTAAYELYIPLYTVATAGFPIAVSRMVSESMALKRYRDVKRIYKVALPFFIITGIICFALMVGLSPFYVKWIDTEDAFYAILCLAPTIFFGCLVSVYRGYFEGLRNMIPTAVSEIIEAVSKLTIGLTLAFLTQKYLNDEYAQLGTVLGKVMGTSSEAAELITAYTIAAAISGITIGSVFSLLYAYIKFKLCGGGISNELLASAPAPRGSAETFKRLVKTAIPIGLGAIVMSVAGTIDSSLILIRVNDITSDSEAFNVLQKVYSGLIYPEVIERGNVHKYLSGCYSYALTLMMLVTSITQVFGTSALPNVTRSFTCGDKTRLKRDIETVLRVTTMFTLPSGLGLTVLSRPILSLLYSSPNVVCEVEIASRALQVLGIAVIFTAISTPLCSLLQAVGRPDMPLKLFLVSTAINMALNYTLIIIPQLNIVGAAIGTLVAYIFVCLAAMYKLCKETKIIPDFNNVLIRPLIASLICAICAYLSYSFLSRAISSAVSTVISIIIAAVIYFFVLLLVRAVTKDDIILLPKGNKIAKTLEKYRLIR